MRMPGDALRIDGAASRIDREQTTKPLRSLTAKSGRNLPREQLAGMYTVSRKWALNEPCQGRPTVKNHRKGLTFCSGWVWLLGVLH
jgi:hypothetical protein